MQHILILIGISGSGKTTFANQLVQADPTYLRLSRDEFRRSLLPVPLNDYWRWGNKRRNRIEELVSELEKTALTTALDKGWNLVIDNTHLRQPYIDDVLRQVSNRSVRVTFKVFDVPLDEAIRRDKARPDVVGATAIREQYDRYLELFRHFNPGQTLLFPQQPLPTREPFTQDRALPICVLVDIDGTIASRADRSPFDWTKVHLDTPRQPVISVVRALRAAGYAVVFLSGRDSVARADTIAWIARHIGWQEGSDYSLFMRAPNDNRKDVIIKRELFEAHIQGRYYVDVVLDDRDQVVSLWRHEFGLTCLQVDYGNF
ncbi:AAA family ATPase [Fibrella sp. WM1]|uniref:phosphatase domain-containing protein n=1 Tax=Fibrella musci TaxID=3242485 RepID=UPI00351FFE57